MAASLRTLASLRGPARPHLLRHWRLSARLQVPSGLFSTGAADPEAAQEPHEETFRQFHQRIEEEYAVPSLPDPAFYGFTSAPGQLQHKYLRYPKTTLQELESDAAYAAAVQELAREAAAKRAQREQLLAQVQPREWKPGCRRVGALARKMGMMRLHDAWGIPVPVTVLMIEDCQVTMVNLEPDRQGFIGMEVAAGRKKPHNVTGPLRGHFARAGVAPKAALATFRVSCDAVLPLGFEIMARHFLAGQFVDVWGITKGKGFSGAMERWGFSGGPASHGASRSHRQRGAIGSAGPARVFKGTKMAGRWGNEPCLVKSLQVYKIDVERNLLFVKGNVPGLSGAFVEVRDAVWKRFDPKYPPPFPTFIPTPEDALVKELVMPRSEFKPHIHQWGIG